MAAVCRGGVSCWEWALPWLLSGPGMDPWCLGPCVAASGLQGSVCRASAGRGGGDDGEHPPVPGPRYRTQPQPRVRGMVPWAGLWWWAACQCGMVDVPAWRGGCASVAWWMCQHSMVDVPAWHDGCAIIAWWMCQQHWWSSHVPCPTTGLGCSQQSPPSRGQGGAWEGSHQQIHLGRCFTDCANPSVERGRNCSVHSQGFFK